ncbi:MAG TPA: M1 family metallopeptidase, partial [Nannocystaceae bacterium]|nr:M1 family metallopeptidase [Nannocystaceae bacterium]
MRSWRHRALGLVAVGLAGCDESAPAPVTMPEPTAALREVPARGAVPADAKVLDVEIDATLDGTTHRIDGRTRLRWHNTSRTSVSTIPFHLYMNGFRAEDTAWMREARGSHRGNVQSERGAWGWIDVAEVVRRPAFDGSDAGTPLAFSEADDPSLMEVELDRPVAPGEDVVLDIAFTTQLPRVFARTGFDGDFHMFGQWYPKPGVLQEDGTWRAHVFSFHSEFYADFADYVVHLDVPSEMVVGATGIMVDETVDGARKRQTWHAEMVHDFAWTADPELLVYDAMHDGIRIRQLARAEHFAQVERHLEAQTEALDSMQARYGPYPWSTITIVHPPTGAEGAGGMEYPTLFTTGSIADVPAPVRWLGFEERGSGVFVTVHEFGHQYFQGLLASDEWSQPWLDEGMNTMSNVLVLDDWHGPNAWMARLGVLELSGVDLVRLAQRNADALQPVDQPATGFDPLVGGYGATVYRKTAALMLTLRNLVGHDAFDEALRRYALAWRFRHPTGADLEAALVEHLGARVPIATGGDVEPGESPLLSPVVVDVADVLEQGLRTTKAVDFRVHSIVHRRALGEAGWHRNDEGVLVEGDAAPTEPPTDAELEAVAVLHRTGDFVIPVEIEVVFTDGTRERRTWSG